MVEARRSSQQRRLSRSDWESAALAAIAEGGLAAVAVEPLAARLGATKGSFYWHFPNREALLEAALARWEHVHTTQVNVEVEAAPGGPVAQLRLLIKLATEMAERDRIGLALLATADHPAVAAALARVTERRIAFIAGLLAKLGFAQDEANRRALLTYSAYLGHAQLAHATPHVLPHSRAAQRAYLDHALSVLCAGGVH
jgi:AcrR family transcriptional regulator